jgi:hypothetical protein
MNLIEIQCLQLKHCPRGFHGESTPPMVQRQVDFEQIDRAIKSMGEGGKDLHANVHLQRL